MDEKEVKAKIIELCLAGIDHKLSLDELAQKWPIHIEGDAYPFFRKVFGDIEDGIEHAPGYWFKKGLNVELWKTTDMFWQLHLDIALLKRNESLDELEQCYVDITARPDMPNAEEAVAEWFQANKR